MSRLLPRLLAVTGVAALLVGLAAGPASAHVSANAEGATRGGFAVIGFRVPTESETASTVGLKVQFPADQPLASVSVKPHPGWTYKVTTAKLATPIKSDEGEDVTEAVSVVEWRATSAAAGIKPGEFDEFQVSAGPLPEADTMTFKAIQRYSDGSEVAWVEEPAPGSTAEPEHPAPTIALAAPQGGEPASAPPAAAPTQANPPAGSGSTGSSGSEAAGASSGSVVGAYVLGALGLLAGLGGLALGLGARRRAQPAAPHTPDSPDTPEGTESVRTGVE
jgi:uncharacterized protein YcnI